MKVLPVVGLPSSGAAPPAQHRVKSRSSLKRRGCQPAWWLWISCRAALAWCQAGPAAMQRCASFHSARVQRTRRGRPAQPRVSCGPAVVPNVTEMDFLPPSDGHHTTAAGTGIIMHQEAGPKHHRGSAGSTGSAGAWPDADN